MVIGSSLPGGVLSSERRWEAEEGERGAKRVPADLYTLMCSCQGAVISVEEPLKLASPMKLALPPCCFFDATQLDLSVLDFRH